jgi:hypothetical protein
MTLWLIYAGILRKLCKSERKQESIPINAYTSSDVRSIGDQLCVTGGEFMHEHDDHDHVQIFQLLYLNMFATVCSTLLGGIILTMFIWAYAR